MSETSDTNANGSSDEQSAESMSVHIKIAGCGFLMGAADIVPGVSGGTVALILGVYERLVTAISHCDRKFVSLLWNRELRPAAERIDLKFVIALGIGILTGIAGLASVMNYLLVNHMSPTFAVFSGMIIASSLLVARRIKEWRAEHVGMLIIGIVVALRIVTLHALKNPPDTLWYMFMCGMIGITAMILPGISGAFILLLLGRYHQITGSIKDIVHGNSSVDVILGLGIFALGCVTGLLGFSRILRWLLSAFHDVTMAILCGFMIGSLYKLWPFQRDLTPDERFKHKEFKHYLPEVSSELWLAIGLCVLGIAAVLVLDFVSRRKK